MVRWQCVLLITLAVSKVAANDFTNYLGFGPILARFPLTLEEGERTEALGPLFYSQRRDTEHTISFPPIFTKVLDEDADSEERDFLYPLLSYDRFGKEYRWHFFQLLSFAGGHDQTETAAKRFTIFPFYFQQRSADTNLNYTALVPFYGTLQKRLFKDEIKFIAFPIYAKTRKRDVVTKNYVYPFYHVRHGDGLYGWQLWPIYGTEHKEITTKTNGFGDTSMVPGHDKMFAPWPFYMRHKTGIGTENPKDELAILPLYLSTRSPNRDSTTVLWPFITWTHDREKQYREVDVPWPVIVFADGPGKTTRRIFPLFSNAKSPTAESDFYLWPLYKYNRMKTGPLDRDRTRILLFLYTDVNERNTNTHKVKTRNDLWPLFTHRKDFDGNERLQLLAPLEPLLPNSKSIDRNWSPVWTIWRTEKNPKAGTKSHSFLWNLYRSDVRPTGKKNSLLFGLFQYESTAGAKHWRVMYIPLNKPNQPKFEHVPEYR